MKSRTIPFFDLQRQVNVHFEDITGAFNRVLHSGRFISGNEVEQFEKKFSYYMNSPHAVACSSGTAALEFILRSWGVGQGDEVIVPANTWVSDAEVVVQTGAAPVFADVDESYGLLTAGTVEKCITSRTKAVIVVHMYGSFCRMEGIRKLADAHDFFILEDCAHAAGLRTPGGMAGTFGDAAAFSFYPTKNLGAFGDAGCVITADDRVAESVRLLRDHGQPSRDVHLSIGTTGRMDEIQAAVLKLKLDYLDAWNERRRAIAQRYVRSLGDSILTAGFSFDQHLVVHLFVVRTPRRDDLKHYLDERKIGTGIHYPVILPDMEAFKGYGPKKSSDHRVARKRSEEILSLPVYPELLDEEVDYICDALQAFS